MMRRPVIVAVTAAVALCIASVALANLSVGTKAPNFSLPTIDGKTFQLKSAQGKVVVLDIWATWCPPCKAEIPHLISLNKKFAGKGVQFVGVAIDQSKSDVSAFAKKQKISYTVCTDPNAASVGSKYRVQGIPATYIIDKKGVIRYVHSGFGGAADAARMSSEISSLLK